VKDYTNTKKCDYQYDALIGARPLVATAELLPEARQAAPVTVAKTQGGPVSLGAEPVQLTLQAAQAPAPQATPLSGSLSALPENHRLYLVINDFKAEAQPGTLYRVYLDLPGGPPSDPLNSHYVGSFNFFEAVPHGDEHAHGDTARSLSFDITDIAADLNAKGLLKAEHVVTIAPASAPEADAKPVVGNISFVEQ
jgi:tyrosinase